MIIDTSGDLFLSTAKTLLNPVNSVGVMSRGISREFKRSFPTMYTSYKTLCDAGQLTIGDVWLYTSMHKWVLNVPIRKHWRSHARLEHLERGLQKIVSIYAEQGITSLAVPRLDDELAPLAWDEVRPLLNAYLGPLPIPVYLVAHAPSAQRSRASVKRWLAGYPQSVSVNRFTRDLDKLLTKQTAFQRLDDGSSFQAHMTDNSRGRSLVLEPENGPSITLYGSNLTDLWLYVRAAGSVQPLHLPNGLAAAAPWLIALLSALPYLDPIRFGNPPDEIGLLYVPPVTERIPKLRDMIQE